MRYRGHEILRQQKRNGIRPATMEYFIRLADPVTGRRSGTKVFPNYDDLRTFIDNTPDLTTYDQEASE